MANVFRLIFRIPYVYSMDSSMAQQLVDSHHWLSPFSPIFNWIEGRAIKRAMVVVPVCPALGELAQKHHPAKILVLTDISLLARTSPNPALGLRQELGIPSTSICFMYVGNLEPYQGIDLLLKSFALAHRKIKDTDLIIVGGTPQKISMYRERACALGIRGNVHFTGPMDTSVMGSLFQEADVLVSPRCKGLNTPMKIYSYLDSGRAVLATDLSTHTQILNAEVALLAPAEPVGFSEAMCRLAQDPGKRKRLVECAGRLVREKHSFESFSRTVNELYDFLESRTKNEKKYGTTS